jgi:hypothetical protein
MGGILGAFQIEDNHHRWLGTAVDELLNEGLGHALEIPGRGGISQTREGGPTSHRRFGRCAGPADCAGDARCSGMALIVEGLCQAMGEAGLLSDAPQQHRAEIREQGAILEIGPDRESLERRETQLLWDRPGPRWPRFASSEPLLA